MPDGVDEVRLEQLRQPPLLALALPSIVGVVALGARDGCAGESRGCITGPRWIRERGSVGRVRSVCVRV